jgi:hypothetical protein
MTFYYSFFPPLKECFQNDVSPVWTLIALVVLIIIHGLIVQFLWNNVLVSVVSGVKPLKSVLYAHGIILLAMLLFS